MGLQETHNPAVGTDKLPYVAPGIMDYGDAQALTQTTQTPVQYVTADVASIPNGPTVYYHS